MELFRAPHARFTFSCTTPPLNTMDIVSADQETLKLFEVVLGASTWRPGASCSLDDRSKPGSLAQSDAVQHGIDALIAPTL